MRFLEKLDNFCQKYKAPLLEILIVLLDVELENYFSALGWAILVVLEIISINTKGKHYKE